MMTLSDEDLKAQVLEVFLRIHQGDNPFECIREELAHIYGVGYLHGMGEGLRMNLNPKKSDYELQ
jgi:hypothetical protein